MTDAQRTPSADRFVAEAARLFATRGFSSTSVADIQVACGLTPGSGALYKHFRSKRALLEAVVGAHVTSMREGSRAFAADVPHDVTEALRFVVDGVWAAMERDRLALRVMLRDLDEFPDLLDDVWSEVRVNVYDEVTRWIEDLVAAGRADVSDPPATAAVLLAALTAHPILQALIGHPPGDVAADRFADAWIRHAAAVLGPRA